MKDKKKQGLQATVSLMLEGELSFHEINEYSWAYGLAIIGLAHESLSEAIMAFDQFWQIQSAPNGEHFQKPDINWLNGQEAIVGKNPLIHLPIAAGILWEIYQIQEDKEEAKEILRKYYPSLLEQQNKLYELRDPDEDGLITNLHPWETGYGLSGHWQDALSQALIQEEAPGDPGHSSTMMNSAYQLFLQLSESKRSQSPSKFGFRVQDPLFHAFLSWNNESLIQMGGALKEDVQDIMEKYELSIYSINERMWSAEHLQYCPYDQNAQKHLPIDIITSSMCLFSEIATQDQAEELYPQLEKQLKKEMQAKIHPSELRPIPIARRILLLQGLGNYGFDELSFLLLQRLTFLLQQVVDNKKENQHDFLIKGFHLFMNN